MKQEGGQVGQRHDTLYDTYPIKLYDKFHDKFREKSRDKFCEI